MFIVIELQKINDEQTATLVTSYANQDVAESKYHDILRAAAVSSLPCHSALIVDETGRTVKGPEFYRHGVIVNE